MRRQLLALLHVREFSSEAEFLEPCVPCVLRDVQCSACQAVADVDACRDTATGGPSDAWRCASCDEPYPASTLEALLLEQAAARLASFQQQDLRCVKCKAVSGGGTLVQCATCGGQLAHTQPPDTLHQQLRVLSSVAAFHYMPMLQDLTEWHLAKCGIVPQRSVW